MIIEGTDPHPGRCHNFRTTRGWNATETVRCLEAEGTVHVCRFPKPRMVERKVGLNINEYQAKDLQPWVVPPIEETT